MNDLITPIFVKHTDASLPDDEAMYYVVTRSGLYLCRKHRWFRSSVPAPRFPTELAEHEVFLEPDYPLIPRDVIERLVGFFRRIAELYESEAGAYLIWNEQEQRVEARVPEQTATVSRGWSNTVWPIGLHYEAGPPLLAHETLVGDIHSHVYGSAYASSTDVADEIHRPGLHVVVGRIDRPEPEFHFEAVVDGHRFELSRDQVLEGFEAADTAVPAEWIERVSVATVSYGGGWRSSGSRRRSWSSYDDRWGADE
jgi:PRTRC genetic system protein A